MVIRSRNGMRVERHTSLHSARATFARSDPELVERVMQARRQLFDAGQLPDNIRMTAEEYDDVG